MMYSIHHYRRLCGIPLMLCRVKGYSLSHLDLFQSHIYYQGPPLNTHSITTAPTTFWQLSPACSVILAVGTSSSTTITSLIDWTFCFAWSCCLCRSRPPRLSEWQASINRDLIGVSLFGRGFATRATISRAPRSFWMQQSRRHTSCLLFGLPSLIHVALEPLIVSGNGHHVYYFAR